MGGEAAIIVFIFVAVGFAWTWLWRQRVTEKPWLQEGLVDDHPSEIDHTQPPARTALYVFLAVVASVFSLFFSAYFLRMEYFDWRPLQEPGLLWVNTRPADEAAASSRGPCAEQGLLPPATDDRTRVLVVGDSVALQIGEADALGGRA